MISPLKDITIGIVLAVSVGLVWRNWKGSEMDRISRFDKVAGGPGGEEEKEEEHH
ncbi:hypothetical protein JG688_00006834 [Phytophthora aleatoria]|uniref:Uncharacterized protein n=1 Tax=Phytophthora aleatoria TaxID=2496075 RepID=A0A8J5IQ83_9STRA|nr:hypothetical protein JG688_00006834 [Phytophthora aleatoria]